MRHVARFDELELLELPAGARGGAIRYFKGEAYGVGLSLLCAEIVPGEAAQPHTHAYDELFVIHSGSGRYTIGQDSVEAGPGDIVVVPAGASHRFVSTGAEPLRHTSVHRSAVFVRNPLPQR